MNSDYYLSILKSQTRERGFTYSQLGERLNLSEAGVKKMFQTGDASLSRILAICDALDMRFEHLIEIANHRPIEEVEFDKEQQNFFTKNPSYFFFYLKLVYEGESAEKIKEEFNLSDRSVWKYLKKLDDLKLIKLKRENKAEFKYTHLKRIKTEGRVFERIKSDLAISFVNRIYESNNPELNRVMMSLYKLSKKSAANLKQDMLDLVESYQRKSEIERTNPNKRDLQEISVLFGFANFSFISGVEEL